jgi:TonB family protein
MGIDVKSTYSTPAAAPAGASDVLLWLGAIIVAVIGAAWLLFERPWEATAAAPAPVLAGAAQSGTATRQVPVDTAAATQTALDDALRMAELAHAAGMLLEPESFGAWSLYERVLTEAPDHAAALAGLEQVADALIERAQTALAQGREQDSRDLLARVVDRLPAHYGARALRDELAEHERAAREEAAAPPRPPQQAAAPRPAAAPDPLLALKADFDRSFGAGRLLAPADDNAKLYVARMLTDGADHPATRSALTALFERLLMHAAAAIDDLDTEAAMTWIDAADTLEVDAAAIADSRAALQRRVIAAETSRPLPVSELTVLQYVPPDYPQRALTRNTEGWVDVEFLVGSDGRTRDIVVTAASDDRLFADAATAAVTQWQFEPRRVMGQAVEQRSFARIRFALE